MFEIEQHSTDLESFNSKGIRYAQHNDKGHGRIEWRQLISTSVDPQQLDWPHARQVALVRRQRRIREEAEVEYAAFVTSHDRQTSASALLELSRDHWSIENSLFHVRDVTFGEDASRIRSDHAPQNLAALRNLAITLMNDAGHNNKAAAQRRYQAHPDQALALVRGP